MSKDLTGNVNDVCSSGKYLLIPFHIYITNKAHPKIGRAFLFPIILNQKVR